LLARTAKSDGKYSKLVTLFTTLVLVMSGLVLSPAHALADGPVNCGTSGTFTITNNVVTNGPLCAGAAVIPEGVTSIGNFAFSGATDLTSITFPASVTSKTYNAFFYATALASFTVDVANENYSSVAGVLFNKDATTLISYPAGKTGTTYSIPASVTSIGWLAFRNATGLTSITIPASVTSIDVEAFTGTTSLTTVIFESDSQLTSIGDAAFQDATGLTSITIPASVTGIGDGAFLRASSLTSITIPASVTEIGENAFFGATALASVYFLGNAPTTGTAGFDEVASGAKAYIKSGATGFNLDTDGDGNSGVWFGLIVTVGFYTVTYNTSGGSAVAAQTYGANFPTPTSPTRTGYTFAGWSAIAGGSVITWPNTPALASDITLYAKWTRNSAKAAARVKPTVSGTPKVSKTLTAKKGTWSGYPTPALTYQWYACTKKVTAAKASVPSTCKKITGATKSTLKLAKAQKSKFISVLVTGKGTGTSATKWLSKSTARRR
jgi:uncharacterized repeat protein (TIGR02543 family)